MRASFNPFMTADPAFTKRPFYLTDNFPITDDASCTTDTIEKAMLYMDKAYNSKFHAWVRSEANIIHICDKMHPMIAEFEKSSPHVIHRAVKWLTAGWSVSGTAELIIKLFFHWGIGTKKFSNLVAEVTRSWAIQPYISELVATLVVAEDVAQVARFIKHLTEGWEVQSVVELVSTIASALQWQENYYKRFILGFVALERGHQRMTVGNILQKFELRKQRLRNFKLARGGKSGNEFCSTIFEMCVLEVHEIRYLRKIESARQDLDNTAIPSLEGEDSDCEDVEGKLSPAPFSLSLSDLYESPQDQEEIMDTEKTQNLTTSSSSSTLVDDSVPSLVLTPISWESLARFESVDEFIARSRLLLEEHRIETVRQAALLEYFEQWALTSAMENVSSILRESADSGHFASNAFDSQVFGRREE